MFIVTCVAPVNIAVIKYWGKSNEELIIPTNDSISATLDTNQLCAKTTIMISSKLKEDRIWLNGREEDINNPRLQNCLKDIKERAKLSNEKLQWKVHVCSVNNFPTAAGLASSAAGYACLVAALAKLYNVEGDISGIARRGSGSACRSTKGGFVQWCKGSDPGGSDSIAKQIAPANHWPEMRILILVVDDERKKVSSTIGMRRSLETSDLLNMRIKHLVPKKIVEMERAILKKDFKTFAELTMRDSNQFHAVCLDTYPPCVYMNDISHEIARLVHSYNSAVNEAKVAYTYDAGPNATLFLLEKDVPHVVGVLDYFFPPPDNPTAAYRKGIPVQSVKPSQKLLDSMDYKQPFTGQLRYMIHTRVGEGPKYLESSEDHLLNDQGLPLNVTV